MGQNNGGMSKTQQLIESLNSLSGNPGSSSADTVTLSAMSWYLNNKDGQGRYWNPQTETQRINRYSAIESLVKEIGMSEKAADKILVQAYKRLNGTDGLLVSSNVPNPEDRKTIVVDASAKKSGPSHPEHPETLIRDLKSLAANPHSYTSLSGQKVEDLLKLGTNSLQEAVKADQNFVAETRNFWTLRQDARADTAEHLRGEWTSELCNDRLELSGKTNKAPTEAFLAGKNAAIAAVQQGYNIYNGVPGSDAALRAFGQIAMTYNCAITPVNTLVSQGANTITEQTMLQSRDGHSNSNNNTQVHRHGGGL